MISYAAQLPLPLDLLPCANSQKGWSYLISDSLAFRKGTDHAIRLQKPEPEKIPEWIARLITSGQCDTIYVEDLSLPLAERSRILQLCDIHSVAVVNLMVGSNNDTACGANVISGPW